MPGAAATGRRFSICSIQLRSSSCVKNFWKVRFPVTIPSPWKSMAASVASQSRRAETTSAVRASSQAAGQHDGALRRIFDHVDDVAQIHDVSGRSLLVRKERRIPTGYRDPHLVQPQQVVATTAAVVEERPLPADEPVVKRECHGAGQRRPADGCTVGSCGAHRETRTDVFYRVPSATPESFASSTPGARTERVGCRNRHGGIDRAGS